MSKHKSRERGSDYSCATLRVALPDLRRPPTAEALRFKSRVRRSGGRSPPYFSSRRYQPGSA